MKKYIELFGLKISTLGLEETVRWIAKNDGVVYCCGLNDVMMANEDETLKNILKKGDLLTTDGMPLVWLTKLKTGKGERVYGPDLMEKILYSKFSASKKQLFVGDDKNKKYFEKFGKYIVLPFKDEFDENDYVRLIEKIKKYKAKIVWIGLGAKKQIIVADELKKRLPKRTYVTVGAAFDFLSGNKRQAPKWLRNNGGEWLFRLINEPERLAGRYFKIGSFLIRKSWGKIRD